MTTGGVQSDTGTIPAGNIVQREILPEVAKDPAYLEKKNMEADEKG